MKKLILSVSILVFISVLCSFSYNMKESKSGGGDNDEAVYHLNPGETAEASDGTSITAGSENERIRICPGSGCSCVGSATIGGVVYTYNGSKGCLRPDIIVD